MRWPNENALTPASLATDGNQGESATGLARYTANDTARATEAIQAASRALDEARQHLALCATLTDSPNWGTVEAADLLDAARVALDGSP